VLAPPDLRVHTNVGLVDRVLVNFGENAAKHTREGSIVLYARLSRRGVVLEVRDTGQGMSAETLDQAADRFYRGGDRAADGFGLGLSIARQAADALGGTLELESTPGAGTVARLVLAPEPA
jgi:signal transduction histidine kinase